MILHPIPRQLLHLGDRAFEAVNRQIRAIRPRIHPPDSLITFPRGLATARSLPQDG